MTRIRQARVSEPLSFHRRDFLEKYGLADYSSGDEPAVFFGCYLPEDLAALREHRGAKVLVWGGSDALDPVTLHSVSTIPDCFNVAISDFVADDLSRQGLPHVRLPVTPVDHEKLDFTPRPKGPAVFAYSSPGRPEFYGRRHVERLRRRCGDIEFRICHVHSYSREELIEVYRTCFVGLRLVPHDGLANTVVELGLLGIPTVHNGGLPGSLPYSSPGDVQRHIREQQTLIGTVDVDLARRTREYIALTTSWLDVDFYRTHCSQGTARRLQTWRAGCDRTRFRTRRLCGRVRDSLRRLARL